MFNETAAESWAIRCSGVSKQYRRFTLEDLDLKVATGSVMGFVGPNGAGKSTTLRIIMGLVHQDRGEVTVLGHSMPGNQVAAKWDIGYASEDMRLYPGQTIGFHLRLLESIFPSWDTGYASTLLDSFGLDAEQRVKGLSHGERVKASLLMVFARRPRLLVFDEPTTGLDPEARQQILQELSAVRSDERRTILFSSHNTLDVEQISDTITFIRSGRTVFSEDKEQLLDSWRRLRLVLPERHALPAMGEVVSVERSGGLAAVMVDRYSPRVESELTSSLARLPGAALKGVERLTLEEIFLTTVADGKKTRQEIQR